MRPEDIANLPDNIAASLREVCEQDLGTFVKFGWPFVEPADFQSNWHIDAVCDHLEAVADGQIKRLILNLPPRHMKSIGANVFYPAWTWLQDLKRRSGDPSYRKQVFRHYGAGVKFAYISYSGRLSNAHSQKCRQLIESQWYAKLWGERVQLDPNSNRITDFDTVQGGSRMALSFSGGVTGFGADIIVIDDAHNIKEIESEVIREETLRVWDEVLPTRLNNPKTGVFIVIMQRSHERDLTGHILAKEMGWDIVCLPASYERDHPIGFQTKVVRKKSPIKEVWCDLRTIPGEPLWKERFTADILAEWSTRLGSHAAAGQLQQRPTAREGGTFKRTWFEIVGAAPASVAFHRVRSWDLASSTDVKSDPDYTVGLLMGRDPVTGIFYICDVARDRWSPGVIESTMKNIATSDGYGTKIRIPQDPGQAGKFQVRQLASNLAGYVVTSEAETGDKGTRADPFAAQAEAGNVKLLRGPWNEAFLDELASFPNGAHDDQVDAASGAFRALTVTASGPLQGRYAFSH
jgi:predicted phage terminase large subunit-like protein